MHFSWFPMQMLPAVAETTDRTANIPPLNANGTWFSVRTVECNGDDTHCRVTWYPLLLPHKLLHCVLFCCRNPHMHIVTARTPLTRLHCAELKLWHSTRLGRYPSRKRERSLSWSARVKERGEDKRACWVRKASCKQARLLSLQKSCKKQTLAGWEHSLFFSSPFHTYVSFSLSPPI